MCFVCVFLEGVFGSVFFVFVLFFVYFLFFFFFLSFNAVPKFCYVLLWNILVMFLGVMLLCFAFPSDDH